MVREIVPDHSGARSHRSTCKFPVSFLCFVAFEQKTNRTWPVPSGLTGLEHSTY